MLPVLDIVEEWMERWKIGRSGKSLVLFGWKVVWRSVFEGMGLADELPVHIRSPGDFRPAAIAIIVDDLRTETS